MVRAKTHPAHRLAACVIAAVTVLAGCGDTEEPRRPNVLLVVFDTTRFDDWSFFGPRDDVTPTLDSLATAGQAFTTAYSLYTATVPSHVTLFTGNAVPRAVHAPDIYADASLFTILGDHGYRTYSFSGNPNVRRGQLDVLEAVHGTMDRVHRLMPKEELDGILSAYGELVVDPDTLSPMERRWYRRKVRLVGGNAESVNRAALDAVEEHVTDWPDRPLFLFLNYNDAHDPYHPEPPFDVKFRSEGASDFNGDIGDPQRRRVATDLARSELVKSAIGLSEGDVLRSRDLHLGEVSFADHHFGRLLRRLDELGVLESAVVICTSDHGELFGEYGRMSHSSERVDELVRVPLVMRSPGAGLAPTTHDALVDHRDLKPTLLEYLGIDAGAEGRSLWPLLRGEVAELEPPGTIPDARSLNVNVVPGQAPETQEKLLEQLRALGYVE